MKCNRGLLALVMFLIGAVAGYLVCRYNIITITDDECECKDDCEHCCGGEDFEDDYSDIDDLQAIDGADTL